MAQPVATVTLKVADIEPVASFITRVCKAESFLRSLTKEEAVALPDKAARAMTELQSAIRDLDASQQAAGPTAGGDDDPFSLERFQDTSHVAGSRPPRH